MQEVTALRVNSGINYGLWVITTRLCRLVSCQKWTTLVGDGDHGVGWTVCWAGGVYRKISSQFCCDPKDCSKKVKS